MTMNTGKGISEVPPEHGCLELRGVPALFLRFETPREQIALLYASLVKLSLKPDETGLELSFLTHQVAVSGKKLAEIYRAIAEAQARVVRVVPEDYSTAMKLPAIKASVHDVRIKPLEADKRRKQ